MAKKEFTSLVKRNPEPIEEFLGPVKKTVPPHNDSFEEEEVIVKNIPEYISSISRAEPRDLNQGVVRSDLATNLTQSVKKKPTPEEEPIKKSRRITKAPALQICLYVGDWHVTLMQAIVHNRLENRFFTYNQRNAFEDAIESLAEKLGVTIPHRQAQ